LSGRPTPKFTLREIPIVVPEPTTLILASVAALGLMMYRRRD
jgi:PEP-CTERM motif-containing protein